MSRTRTAVAVLAAVFTIGLVGALPAQAVDTGTVTVTVQWASGAPAADQYVSLEPAASNVDGTYASGSTGATGKATLTGVAYGAYTLSTTVYGGARSQTLTKAVTVSAATTAVTLKVTAFGDISGVVTVGGKPVPNTWVSVQTTKGVGVTSASTDAAGRYVAAGLAAGSYRVLAQQTDTPLPNLSTYLGGTVRMPDGRVVTLAKGKGVAGANIAMVRAAVVKGKVVTAAGKPAKNVFVYGSNTTRAGWAYATTDATGAFTLTGLASGKVVVDASPNRAAGSATWYDAERTVTAHQGSTVGTGTLKLVKHTSPTGKVTGTLAGGATSVAALSSKGVVAGYTTAGTKHTFTIGGLATGTYRLVIPGTDAVAKTVKVTNTRTTKAGTLKKPASTTVKGVVRTSSNAYAKGDNVSVYDKYGLFVGSSTVSAKGAYSVKGVVSGKIQVVAGSTATDLSKTVTTTVTKGKTKTVTLKLVKGRVLAGKVVASKTGKPVAGVTVYSSGGGYSSAGTATSGAYSLRPVLKATTVTVYFSDPYVGGYLDRSVKVGKTATKVATVKLS